MATLRNTLYYEFWKMSQTDTPKLVSTGTRVLSSTQISTGIDTIPTMSLTIPLVDMPEENLAMYTVKVFIQVEGIVKYKFIGTVDNMDIDYANYSVTLNLSHQIARMREWVMPVNYTVKNTNLSHVIGEEGAALGYSSRVGGTQMYDMRVNFEYRDGAENYKIEMTFGSLDKLAALSEILKQTEDLHFVVDLFAENGDKIIIGKFGDKTDIEVSPIKYADDDCEEKDPNLITMLTEPRFSVNYTGHYNRAVTFCGDVDEGVLHLTLKEIYERPELWVEGFPLGMYDQEINLQPEPEYAGEGDKRKQINNEKVYENNELVAYASNDNREYFVTDAEQLALDGGIIKHTTYNFSELYPIPKLEETNEQGEKIEYAITDDDRLEITKRAYYKTIRNLKAQRPEHKYQFNCTALPPNTLDGVKVHFLYSKDATEPNEDCDTIYDRKRVMNIDEYLYITNRTIAFDNVLNEYTTLTLDKELRINAVNATEIELTRKIQEESSGTSEEKTITSTVPEAIERYPDSRDGGSNIDNREFKSRVQLPSAKPQTKKGGGGGGFGGR